MNDFLKSLDDNGVWTIYDWNLTEEDEKKFSNSDVGDEVQIDVPLVPALFTSGDGDKIYVPVYTSELEMPITVKRKYALQEEKFRSVIRLADAVQMALGKEVIIVVDQDSNDWVELTRDMVDMLK